MAERSLDVSLRIGGAVQRSVGSAFRQVKQQGQRTAKEIAAASREANRATRQQLRSQMLEAAAPALAIALPVRQAMQFETAMAGVNKVVDFDSPQGLHEMGQAILKLTTDKRIPMAATGIADIVAAAGQANIARDELVRFGKDAAEMGVAFDMSGAEAGDAMAGMRNIFELTQDDAVKLGDAFNYLSNKMAAQARDIVNITNRVGKWGKIAGLTGEQIAAMGATFLASKTGPEQASTAMNELITSLSTADQQAPKFQDALAELGVEAGALKAHMQDDAQGAILSFLETIKASDDPVRALAGLFGPEYAKQIAKLVDGLDGYKRAIGLIADESKYAGAMHQEYLTMAKTSANNMQILKNQANRLAITVGSVLLPALNTVMSVIGQGVGLVTALAERFPVLTQVVGVSVASLVTFRLVSLGSQYASTFLSDSLVNLRAQFARLRPEAVRATLSLWRLNVAAKFAAFKTFATAAIPAAIAGLKALSVAALTTPIGWIALGIAGAALLIWAYWKPLKALFTGLWHGLMMGLAPIGAALKEAFAPLAPIMTALKSAFVALFGPIDANATTLEKLTALGVAVGETIGTLISVTLWPLVRVIRFVSAALDAVFNSSSPLAVIQQTFGEVMAWLGTFSFFGIGKAIMGTLVEGFKASAGLVLGSVTGVFGKLKNLLPGSDAKTGPLSRLTASGRGMMAAIGQGVTQGQGSLVQPLAAGLAGAGLLLGSPSPGFAGRGGGAPISITIQMGDVNVQAAGDGTALARSVGDQVREQLQRAGREAAEALRGALHDGDSAGLGSV